MLLIFSLFIHDILFSKKGAERMEALKASYPISRGFCYANLDGYQYDFRPMSNTLFTYHAPNEIYTYYMRLCRELSDDDIKIASGTTFDFSDVFVARCDSDNTTCKALITENAFDWRYLNANKKSEGVEYFAIGEPFRPDSKEHYYSFDIEFEVSCDHTDNDPSPNPRFIFDNIDTTETLLRVIFSNTYGCGETVDEPTPTPHPFAPKCDYTDRYDDLTDYGVDIHLQDMNGGPGGVRAHGISFDGGASNSVLFFQPCERMECPNGYQCEDTQNYSSAWICNDQNNHICESLGLIDPRGESFISPAFDHLFDGINLTYSHPDQDKAVTFILKCDQQLPTNHFLFGDSIVKEGSTYQLEIRSKNSCPTLLPDPTPQPDDRCVFNRTQYEQQSTIFLNLTAHDKHDMKGWSTKVTLSGTSRTGTLYYEPCDNAVCPPDAYCEGDEDATVFLCQTDSDNEESCVGYGLLENRISMSFKSFYDVTEGILVGYHGDFERTAEVTWLCDSTMDDNVIRLPSDVKLGSNSIMFDVYAKAACGSGNPTPRPPYHPPRPTPPSEPTPTPQPSVNPTDVYVINETHYLLTPLQTYNQGVFRGNLTLMGPHPLEGKVYAEFHPWDMVPCPSGWECSAGHKEANFWVCWIEDDGTKYCHATGDVRILNEMYPRTESNPDYGVELHFGGVWGLDTYFDIECDPYEDNYSIPFDMTTVLRYVPGGLGKKGPYFITYLDSGAVCPRKFVAPPTPYPTPYITPEPGYTPTFHYDSITDKNHKYISIDLDVDLPEYYEEIITIGLFPNYQRNLFKYYPVNKGPAPSGYTILDSDPNKKANVWRCFNSSNGHSYCHSAGDADVKLEYTLIDEDNLLAGVSLNYEGGYGQWETHVQLICNESVPLNRLDFDDVGTFIPSTKSPIIFAHTKMACPVDSPYTPYVPPGEERDGITGGAIFLIIVVGIAVLYISIGMFVSFIKDGLIEIPNHDFWEDFFESVKTGFLFIFTCGKSNKGFSYDQAI